MACTHILEWYNRFEEGYKNMKDDSRSGRTSTNQTGVNVEQVRQVVSGNHPLTVWLIASHLDMKMESVWKIMTKYLGLSEKLWDWVCWVFRSSQLRGTLPYRNNLPFPLILLCVTFFFSSAQKDQQGDHFWRCGGHEDYCKDGAEGHVKGFLPAVYRSVRKRRKRKCIRFWGNYLEGENMEIIIWNWNLLFVIWGLLLYRPMYIWCRVMDIVIGN